MAGRAFVVVRALAAAALLAGCSGAGADTPQPARAGDNQTVEIGTALICDRTTCDERAADGRLVRSYPTPVTQPSD